MEHLEHFHDSMIFMNNDFHNNGKGLNIPHRMSIIILFCLHEFRLINVFIALDENIGYQGLKLCFFTTWVSRFLLTKFEDDC
jgi:hypothetical protein